MSRKDPARRDPRSRLETILTKVLRFRRSLLCNTTYWSRQSCLDTDLVTKFLLKNVILSLILKMNLIELVSNKCIIQYRVIELKVIRILAKNNE